MALIGTVKTIWNGLNWSYLVDIALNVIPALICITLHELAHGFVAYRLGDNTAKNAGRLTLNPIKHIDIMGLAMMALFKFGWAKPVPVNMRNFKNPRRGMAITALAGPLANIIIALVFLFLYGLLVLPLDKLGAVGYYIGVGMINTAYLSTAFAIFNIIPISPLDGSKVLYSFLPDQTYYKLMRYERYGMIILMVLIFALNKLNSNPLGEAASMVFDRLFPVAEWGYSIACALGGI